MSDIQEGDKVVRRGVTAPTVWTVKAVRDGDLWLSAEGYVDCVVLASSMVKVEPKFEVGKTYRPVEEKSRDFTIKIESVNDRWAIGWLKDGEPWNLEQSLRNLWVEMSDEETAVAAAQSKSAESVAEQSRKLTKVMVTTYNPENYILRNTEDGTEWKISPEGNWVEYYPVLPF